MMTDNYIRSANMVKCTDFKCSMNFDKYIHLVAFISNKTRNIYVTPEFLVSLYSYPPNAPGIY